MKGKHSYNLFLVGIVILGLLCSLWLNLARHAIEEENNTVEMAMEYENLRKLAALEGLSEEEVLLRFKGAGINSLMIFDTTLERLARKGEIRLATGEELRKASALGADRGIFASVPEELITENAAYVAVGSLPEILNDVKEDLCLRYGEARVMEISAAPRVIRVLGSTALIPEDKFDEPLGLLQAPLGLPAQDMAKVAALGFNVIVRPQNYINVTETKIDSIFKRIAKSGVTVKEFMPCGKETVGYPDKVDYLGKKLQENKMTLIMLEHYTQLQFAKIEGLVPLAEANNYRAARSYVIDPLEQKRLSVPQALRRWALTDEERNIRVNYLRPFFMPVEGKSLMTTNLKYVSDIKAAVLGRGYTISDAGVFSAAPGGEYAPYFPARPLLIPVAMGIIASCVLYLGALLPLGTKWEIALWAVVSVIGAALLLLGRGLLVRQSLSIGAACIFPVLSMSFIWCLWDKNTEPEKSLVKIIFQGIWQLALAVVLSLIGAAYLSAILTDSRFMLEIDIYRGVKLTFMLPVLLTAVLFVRRYDLLEVAGKGLKALWQRLNGILDTNLSFRYVVVLGVLLFIVYYFIGRSGHTGGVSVPAIEIKMRNFLETVMYARPREKEFMIGHPAFFLAVWASYRCVPRWWQFVLVCGAVIGQGSLVQTFCHMRTPVVMSLIRAVDGYLVGLVFGIVGVVLFAGVFLPLLVKIKRRYLGE